MRRTNSPKKLIVKPETIKKLVQTELEQVVGGKGGNPCTYLASTCTTAGASAGCF